MERTPEPWLRGTLAQEPAVLRGVLHALELAEEDAVRWCGPLSGAEVHAHPAGLPSVAFQLRHIAGSLDRLLTYAEGRELDDSQLESLARESEGEPSRDVSGSGEAMAKEFARALRHLRPRIRAFAGADLEAARTVGRRGLPTTLGGLLVHLADHTQRHSGQLVTTAKVLLAGRSGADAAARAGLL